VVGLIHRELENSRLGKITPLEMEQTKKMIRNNYLLTQDSQGAIMEDEFIKHLLPNVHRDKDEYLAGIEAVDKKDVIRVANTLERAAIFFLDGGEA
jgi:predicted Zn-dependent peptidase